MDSNSAGERLRTAREFLECVLPDKGYYIAVVFNAAHPRPGIDFPRQVVCSTIDELARILIEQDTLGRTVYHACASFKDPSALKLRGGANALWCRSLFADIDAGPEKPYADANEAYRAVVEFCRKTGLDLPVCVGSGNGIHTYWPLTESVSPEHWLRLSRNLKQLAALYGLQIDPSRTADIASILRTPGTHHRKNGERLVQNSDLRRYDIKDFQVFLNPSSVSERRPAGAPSSVISRVLSSSSYPASYADRVVDGCAQIASFRASGDISNPRWYASLGVTAWCEDGNVKTHEWSKNGFERYNREETENCIRRVRALSGATTCAKLDSVNAGLCQSCKHWGNINSPISLGLGLAVSASTERPSINLPFKLDLPALPEPFSWSETGGLQIETENNGGEKETTRITEYPIVLKKVQTGEIKRDDHSYTFAKYKPKEGWDTFQLDADVIHGAGAIGALAKKGVVIHEPALFMRYLRGQIDEWHKMNSIATEYDQMGWKSDDTAFLLGNRLYCNRIITPVAMAKIVKTRATYLVPVPTGSLVAWSEAIEYLCGVGFEAQLFMTLCAPASVLMRFQDQTEGGCVVHSYTEGTARGKTMALRGGWTFFGLEHALRITKDASQYSKFMVMGSLGNLPFVHDELSHKDPEFIRLFLSTFRDGKDRLRGAPDGTVREILAVWNMILMSAANRSLIATVGDSGPDALAWRILEINGAIPKVEAHLGQKIAKALEDNAGWAGDAYITWLTQAECVPWVKQTLREQTQMVWKLSGADERYRVRVNALGAIATASIICRELKIINHQPSRIIEWGIKQMMDIEHLSGASVEDPAQRAQTAVGSFLNAHVGEVIVVGDAWKPKTETPAIYRPQNQVSIRYELKTQKLYIASDVFHQWCEKRDYPSREVIKELLKSRVVIDRQRRITLTAGTGIAGMQIWTLEIDARHAACSGIVQEIETKMKVSTQ